MSTETPSGKTEPDSAQPDWETVQASPEFQALRSRLRRFVFPVAAAFLTWYLAYVLLASYAPAFMAIPVVGAINIGLILGLLQFVSTFAITTWYVRWADKRFDPHAKAIREEIEGGTL
ncbi:DUF485 domain-containing protein [Pseudonocardia sp. WMMC193]|uniref:DUF485 domain-containing protein n=1 Tax=Pseudonocardia sp. WMMC193 TaxID=2911965 RepID=UPI001F399D27|nr:DUF485 domain-containing protein [Pseudonocardia sp. WMMC193]MCF7551078.1 DUF485 domain-containing protein [Pseudonocardia sp. WMMC193]